MILKKVDEELDEVKTEVLALEQDPDRLAHAEEEIGDLLFVLANLARHLMLDPEVTLRKANAKFERRFYAMEAALAKHGRTMTDCDLDRLEALWQEVKRKA